MSFVTYGSGTITGYTGTGALSIPETIGGETIIAIGAGAFLTRIDLTNFDICSWFAAHDDRN
jgi:hypothetical protein